MTSPLNSETEIAFCEEFGDHALLKSSITECLILPDGFDCAITDNPARSAAIYMVPGRSTMHIRGALIAHPSLVTWRGFLRYRWKKDGRQLVWRLRNVSGPKWLRVISGGAS